MMRKLLVIGVLALTMLVASSSDAFAQRRGGGGRGGNWNGGGRGSWGGNNWGGRGTGVYIGGGGIGVYGNGYGVTLGGYGRPYYGSYGSSYYSSPYYYSSPSYYEPSYTYESTPIVQGPATDVRQSYYSEPSYSQQAATMVVLLPRPDATVLFDNAPTSQQGTERTFVSPPLVSGGTYTYSIRARWMENGQPVERERRVNVQPGQTINVDFRGPAGETLQAPRSN